MNKKLSQALESGLLDIEAVSSGIYRIRFIRNKRQRESMLTRYGIVKTELDGSGTLEKVKVSGMKIEFAAFNYGLTLDLSAASGEEYEEEGFQFDVPLLETDRLFGLGDENRDVIMKRGRVSEMWQADVDRYGPIPYIMCSSGWALFVNSTYRHRYDLGASDPNTMRIESTGGALDVYVLIGENMREALNLYTSVSGRPAILPKAAYGLTFVCHEKENARDVLENCLHFRRDNIPCDIIGLEPGWMDKYYDFSVNKKWNKERAFVPSWLPDNSGFGPQHFTFGMKKMGFMLSLWLCIDYDLLWEEEKSLPKPETKLEKKDASHLDVHLQNPSVIQDQITVPGQPWFEHLKKFVDNGAGAFKLDGGNQVLDHPDRIFAGKYLDEEVHNVYPVILGKQMANGFAGYTGRRPMIYTSSAYAGQQQYCATWAGDTGGDFRTMVSIMNYAMSGHVNTSCDMDISDLSSVHYCFLMPWTQHCSWCYWKHPWFMGDELEGVYREYAQLRSRLFPYIYSAAHQAYRTGLPITRPMSLMYDGNAEFDDALNQYMFGDNLLVSSFKKTIRLPEGIWTDFFTGEKYEGGCEFKYEPPQGKGGALLVCPGGIIVLQDWMPHLNHHKPTRYEVHVYTGADNKFTLYEDDGISLGYKNGEVAETEFELSGSDFIVTRKAEHRELMNMCPIDVIIHHINGGTTAETVPANFESIKIKF